MTTTALVAAAPLAAHLAGPQAASSSNGGGSSLLLPIILIVFVGFMFISSRRRRAAAQQNRQGLRPGAVVVTAGGLHATVQSINEGVVSLEIAPGVISQFEAASIARVVSSPGGDDDIAEPERRLDDEPFDRPAGDGDISLRKPTDEPPTSQGRPA